MFRAVLATSIGLTLAGACGLIGPATPEASSAPARIAAPGAKLAQLLGFVDARLVGVDRETLRPLPGTGVAVGSGGCASRQGGTACWRNPPWTTSSNGA